MANYTIKLNNETEAKAKATIEDIIKQAQNGVTIFSAGGILMNLLFDLDYDYLDDED